jgi:hypothetical protein
VRRRRRPVGRLGPGREEWPGSASPGFGAGKPADAGRFPPQTAIQPLTPQEEQKRFILPPGYRMELVLSDPEIVNPTAIAFDGNGST